MICHYYILIFPDLNKKLINLAWQHVVSNRNSVIASFHDCQFSFAEMLIMREFILIKN
jgi:hypothetical protein